SRPVDDMVDDMVDDVVDDVGAAGDDATQRGWRSDALILRAALIKPVHALPPAARADAIIVGIRRMVSIAIAVYHDGSSGNYCNTGSGISIDARTIDVDPTTDAVGRADPIGDLLRSRSRRRAGRFDKAGGAPKWIGVCRSHHCGEYQSTRRTR